VEGVGIIGTVFGVIVAGAAFLLAYFNNATRLMKRVDDLTSRVFALQDEAAQCRQREGELKVELTSTTARIRALETATGTAPPPPLSGIVVADLKGNIREFSPALTPIFQYLPKEVVGKPITMLIPPEIRPQHDEAFRRGVADPENIDSGREVLTYGLSKTGSRVPIGLTMHGWRAGGEGLITATIRQRLPADPGSSGVNPGG
jgi:PAS domain S-box-containing protein